MQIVIEMSKEKLLELLLRDSVKVIQNQKERIQSLETEVEVLDGVVEGLEQVVDGQRETINELVKDAVRVDAEQRTSKAFLAILRHKLSVGAPAEEVVAKITKYLEA